MESLRRLVAMEPVELPDFCLDLFQQAVLTNLYLEFFLDSCRVLIAPSSAYLTTGEISKAERRELGPLLGERRDRLTSLRRYVVVNLALYTALLETNSYYLRLNDHLLICRFLALPDSPDEYLIKLYTIAENDLPANYKDKIYLGRDRLSMITLRRDHFGICFVGRSLIEQVAKLKERLARMVPARETEIYRREYLPDLEETLAELNVRLDEVVTTFPVSVFTHSPEVSTLLAASVAFRQVKHVLVEIEDTLREMEQTLLREGHPRGARYVTMMRRDVTNSINFIMCKVNGRISNVVNRVDALAYFQTPAGVGA